MPSIPVIPYQEQGQAGAIAREEAQDRINNPHLWDQEFENEMERRKGRIGLKEMLNSKDQVGNTLFNFLKQTAGEAPAAGMDFLKNKFAPAVGNFMFGPTPDVPRDMQGTEMVPDPQNPGKFIHPGALQIQQRDSMF